MEIILYLLFAFLKYYFILGCIFTLLTAFFAFSTRTENEYTVGEIFAILLFYPFIIYYIVEKNKNKYER
jgi:hypothetical protein